jgi:uncharacterized protein (UPF0332 family)/predicted nucleotidyltransferase
MRRILSGEVTCAMKYLAEIQKFRDALIKSDIGAQITKVVWFGSTLKKRGRKESDVDVLIVTTDGAPLRDRIADILLDFQMEAQVPLEIVTSSVDDLYPLTDPFLKNILTYGQEVYSMPARELKHSAARHYLSLAQEYYDAAEDTLQRGHYRLALDGAYNAAELAVEGFLVLKILDLPGSHGGLAQRFGELYIKPGTIDRAVGRRLNRSLELRNAARYKFTATVSQEDASSVLSLAEDLIALLEKKL